MRALFNFVEADTGFDIGNYNQMELAFPPQAGDMIGLLQDGQKAEALYHVEGFKHVVHEDFGGDLTQIVDIFIRRIDILH